MGETKTLRIYATVVNVGLSVVQTELNATLADIEWIVECYSPVLAALVFPRR